ncbi:diglucosyl diacylglycerol synthase [Staphylococcus aureus]|nr:diglucosyl diacylglycerol synthase [Staphylococcus aureus]
MKKLLLPLIIMLLVLAACGNQGEKNNKAETKSYKMDDGKTVDIPKDPKRIAVVAPTYAGGLKKLGANIVAVNQQVDQSKVLKDKFKGVTKIGDGDVEKVAKEKPDLILLTFPTPVMSVLTEQFNINIPVATVMTDYRLHKNWITPYSTRYYVATKETKQDFIDVGIDPSTVKVTGIPIDNKFETPINQKQWLIDNNLDPDKQTILMSAGAFGVSKGFDTMITDILAKSANAQVVMICGKSKELKRSLTAKFKSNENVLILGYTKHMNEWMASSQLMITKPGGITITEGFARCIPMIFLNPAPGQELENALYFEEKGFGKIADTPEEAIKIVASLTNGNEQLTNMISTMEQDKIKYATQTICRDLLDLIGHSSQPQEIYGKVPLYARFFVK